MTVHPTGSFAYVANAMSNDISGYAIDGTTGTRTAIADSPFAAGRGPVAVTFSAPASTRD